MQRSGFLGNPAPSYHTPSGSHYLLSRSYLHGLVMQYRPFRTRFARTFTSRLQSAIPCARDDVQQNESSPVSRSSSRVLAGRHDFRTILQTHSNQSVYQINYSRIAKYVSARHTVARTKSSGRGFRREFGIDTELYSYAVG